MKVLGAVLVILGIVALVYGGIGYRRDRTIVEMGSMRATVTEEKKLPVSPVVGVLVVIGGVAMIVVDRRRSRPR